jgi:serine/threonine-protein kinase RsbW
VIPEATAQAAVGKVELTIPSKAEWVAVARLAVAAVASRLRFSVDEIDDIKLAVAEACTNCIQHGSSADELNLTCEVLSDQLRVTVRDRGATLRLESVGEGAFGNESQEDLGVFLIRALMDTVHYRFDKRDGTELVMTKRVTQ